MTASRDVVVAVCDAYIAAMSAHEPDRVVKLFAENASHEEPIGTPVRHGWDEIHAFLDEHNDMGFVLSRLGPVTVVGNHGAFQARVEVPTPQGTRTMAATDLVTVDEDGLISRIVVLPDPHADPTQD